MYKEIESVIKKLPDKEIREEKEIFDKFKDIFKHYKTTFYPATRIYEVIAGPYWGKYGKVAGKWRHIILCLLSLCKLTESIIKLKLPLFFEKTYGLVFDLYSTLYSLYLAYPKRVTKYFANETSSVTYKEIIEFKRLVEVLAFEQ